MRRTGQQYRHPALSASLIALAAVTVGCATEAPPAAGPGQFSAQDRSAVQAAWDAVTAADRQADWDTSETLMTDDFIHLDPRVSGPLRGRGPWREWVDGMGFGAADVRFAAVDVAGSGDMAYVVWTLEGSFAERGETVMISAKGMSLFERQDDGRWLLAANAWNANPS